MNITMVHHRTTAPIKPTPLVGPWKCNVCNAKFTDIKAHVQHMGSHALEYPSSCPLCLARFKTTEQLGNHVCVANNKSRACNTSNNVNINNNNNNNYNRSAISEKTHLQRERYEKSAGAEVITQPATNNHLNNIIAGSSSSSELSPVVYDDGPDDEDIFEAAQNPANRNRSCSVETNKDFLVTDPWEACSAIISSDGDAMVVGSEQMDMPEQMAGKKNEGGSTPNTNTPENVEDFINELIQPIIPPPPLTRRPSISQRRHRNNPATQNRRHSKSTDSSSHGSVNSNNSSGASTEIIMPEIGIPATSTPVNSTTPLNLLERMDEEEEPDIAVASHHGSANQPDGSFAAEPATGEISFDSVLSRLECPKCRLRFFDHRSWVDHHINIHIGRGPLPVVALNRLKCLEVSNTMKAKNERAVEQFKAISPSSSSTQGQAESPGEQKKDRIPTMIVCKNADTFFVKTKSTDSSPEPSTPVTTVQPSLTTPIRRPSAVDSEAANMDTDMNHPPMATTSSEYALPDIPKTNIGGQGEGPLSQTSAGSNIGRMRPQRFLQLVKSMQNSFRNKRVEQMEKRAQLKKERHSSNSPRDGNQEPDKSSMTPPTTSENCLPSSSHGNEKEQEQVVPNTGRGDDDTVIREGESQGDLQDKVGAESTADSQINADLTRIPAIIKRSLSSAMTAESELVVETETISVQPRPRSGGSASTEEALVTGDLERSCLDERDKSVAENNDDDNDNPLVIDTGIEEEDLGQRDTQDGESGESSENVQGQGKGSSVDGEKDPAARSATGEKEGESGTQEEANEDFRCQVCHKMFSSDDEVNSHFSTEHFRTVGSSILEPESPFPTGNVEGSSFMEDEMDCPEQMPVETQLIEFPETTLSNLLRRNSNDERTPFDQSAGQNQSLGYSGGPGPSSLQMRQSFTIGRGYPPPRMSPPFMMQSEGRPMGPPISQPGISSRPPGFPSALHRALIDQAQNHYQSAPPPRPQLRPIPTTQMRGPGGVQISHVPNRPPLTRVPSAMPMGQLPTRNPNSILRPVGQPIQQRSAEDRLQELRNNLKLIDEELRRIDHQALQETNPGTRNELLQRRNDLLKSHQACSSHYEGIKKQQQQQLMLQRQQMLQLDAQSHSYQQQQLRQHQLQQVRNRLATENPAAHFQQNTEQLNANGKRPGMTDANNLGGHDPKQPRLENQHIFSIERNAQSHENLSRMTNGILGRPMPHMQPSSTVVSAQMVQPGMHSGGSTGSRHSSGSTSPAIASPVAQRLAHSGITLTPSSPSPLNPLSPPANPNLSPVSDTSPSPRGSPRIQVGHFVQNVMNTCGVPSSTAMSPGSIGQTNFACPKPPLISVGSGRTPLVTVSHSERPDRPPTVDLTDDDIHLHNAQMRATGQGAVTRDQIQFHEAAFQQRRGMVSIPGTSQFSIRPVNSQQGPTTQNPTRPLSNAAMNINSIAAHRQIPIQPAQQAFRQPPPQQLQQQPQGPLMRHASPGNVSHIRPNNIIPTHGIPPPRPQMQMRAQNPPTIVGRQQNQPQSQLSAEACKNLVIPLLNMDRLDPGRIRALNDIGVTSFIPLEGVRSLGIPVLRLRPDIPLGHFPHDTAVEIGSACHLVTSGSAQQQQQQQQQVRRTPPTNILVPSHAAAQPSHHPHPPSVISPPMGTICTDRSCSELMQQRGSSTTSVIHHSMTHAPNQISIRPIIQQQQQQQQQHRLLHESFLGGSSSGTSPFGGGGNRN